jgi:hypothetical protein
MASKSTERRDVLSMNIFKVLATGKKLAEEQMTALLAWLLNPEKEHGLGYELLKRFIVSISNGNSTLTEISNNLFEEFISVAVKDVGIELEKNVPAARLDMLISIEEWKIGVENKVNPDAADDLQQLNKEYNGLITKYGDNKCILVFLVPTDGLGVLHYKVQRVYDTFDRAQLRPGEFLKIMTWQKNDIGFPTIISLLDNLLRDEVAGKIKPLNDYARNTLKALSLFINDNFSGYERENIRIRNENCLRMRGDEILNKSDGFVGIKGGVIGLIRQNIEKIKTTHYKFGDIPENGQWVSVNIFQQICNYKEHGIPHRIEWDRKEYPASLLYFIVSTCSPEQPLYIGIQGGLRALKGMGVEKIKSKKTKWLLSDTQESNNWISGADFKRELEEKNVYGQDFAKEVWGT